MAFRLIGIDLEEDGFYKVVAPDDAVNLDETQTGPNGLPIVLVGDWVYVSGDNPRVRTDKVGAAADGSTIVMQQIPADSTTPARTRIILLEGDSGSAWVIASPTITKDLSANQYVDCYQDQMPPFFSEPAAFDPATTPGGATLMDGVQEGRRAWRV